MLRLNQRMQIMKAQDVSGDSSVEFEGNHTEIIRDEINAAKAAPSIVLDNVAAYYAESPKQKWKVADFPNVAPPFQVFFLEWNMPRQKNMGGHMSKALPYWMQCGLLCSAIPPDSEINNKAILDRIAARGHIAKWIVYCSPWAAIGGHGAGKPLWLGNRISLIVGPSGELLEMSWYENGQDLNDMVFVGCLGLSFMHCKNVSMGKMDVASLISRRDACYFPSAPRLKYHVLQIGAMRQILRHQGREGEVGLAKALHICRGHFAHYEAERPLFGKYVGTFWRPDHVRGSESRGAVVKDYEARLPQHSN